MTHKNYAPSKAKFTTGAIDGDWCYLDVKHGRGKLRKTLKGGVKVPVIVHGVITMEQSRDDGVSQEFQIDVTKIEHGHVAPWATVRQVKAGTLVVTDAGFTCVGNGKVKQVFKDEAGLYIQCKDGQHYLDGQLDDTGKHYVGLWLA